jgi:hypothetical protein
VNTLEILRGAREVLSDSSRWTKGQAVVDAHNTPCPMYEGVAFCAMGAMGKAVYDRHQTTNFTNLADAIGVMNRLVGSVPVFNDSCTHDELLQAFDEAIAAEEKSMAVVAESVHNKDLPA